MQQRCRARRTRGSWRRGLLARCAGRCGGTRPTTPASSRHDERYFLNWPLSLATAFYSPVIVCPQPTPSSDRWRALSAWWERALNGKAVCVPRARLHLPRQAASGQACTPNPPQPSFSRASRCVSRGCCRTSCSRSHSTPNNSSPAPRSRSGQRCTARYYTIVHERPPHPNSPQQPRLPKTATCKRIVGRRRRQSCFR